MSQKKEWVGIRQNTCTFQGKIVEDPQIVPDGHDNFIFMTLRTAVLNRSANGQVVEEQQDVPLMVEPGSSAQRVAKDFIMAGRKILARCEYKTWKTQNGQEHKFSVSGIVLGDKPYTPQPGPNLPS